MAREIATMTYTVTKAFDYLTEGRSYTFRQCGKQYVDVRRIDGSGIGTYLRTWQFKQAIERGWLVAA
jgi:hypothetical protein